MAEEREPDPPAPEVEAEAYDARERGERSKRTYDVRSHSPGNAESHPPGDAPPHPPGDIPPSAGTTTPRHGWAIACHLTTLASFGFPVLLMGLIGPFAIWQVLKDKVPAVIHHGKEALNFQLNILFWSLIAYAASACCLTSCIGVPLAVVLPVVNIFFTVVAAIRTADGERYRYPLVLRVIV